MFHVSHANDGQFFFLFGGGGKGKGDYQKRDSLKGRLLL